MPSLQELMIAGIQDMQSTKAAFDETCRRYHSACIANNWPMVETLRLEVVSSCETSMDAVAMAYRRVQEAERNGR
jgi:hypothetical protein